MLVEMAFVSSSVKGRTEYTVASAIPFSALANSINSSATWTISPSSLAIN